MNTSFCGFLFLSLSVLCLSTGVEAQKFKPGIIAGVNGMYISPKGSLGNQYRGGPGGEVLGGIGFGKTYLVATTGYGYLFDRGSRATSNLTYQPVKIGVRQYVLGKRLFVNGDIGRATIKNRTKSIDYRTITRGVGAGVRLLGLETSVYYDGWKNKDALGFSNSLQYKLGWNITL